MTPRHVFPVELVLICVFPARMLFGADADFHTAPLTVKPGGGASFLRPEHPPASSLFPERRGVPFPHTPTASYSSSSSSSSRTPPPTLSCSRRCLHPPSSGCASARPALLSRRPDGKRGALCGRGVGIGAFSRAHAQI